ncbi:Alpha/Beta hydrolase protein [Microdochium trichocladiopsis]|uniref:Carboxylic ester hydrolase n=1 Tax=Microdochium trichocladiopsis TaxID=1682393 RepID=A0A9P8YCX0_9PEZI|nr:Alpha/Beta hydrolase protein [Microdochium trichocladiopsis]KAH7036036.1 Alpha/Beta hydrolase protein [Microdochium trichocladiopsis]
MYFPAAVAQLALLLAAGVQSAHCSTAPTVVDERLGVSYTGFERNGVEVFQGIRFGLDTGGEYRFRPPRPYVPETGRIIDARQLGAACPQETGRSRGPLSLGIITSVSEDCLNLNIVRPKKALSEGAKFPVMVWIYGGGLWVGYNGEPTTKGDGVVLESIENGLPVIHVTINYRLGVFGFAQSGSLKEEKSENAGVRDQHLAIEWVRDNIAAFGGDPENITIYGQSSGGFSVTAQLLAYGGEKPVPFQKGICESQAIATGLTGTYTRDAMQVLVDYVGCNTTALDDAATISCLKSIDTLTLTNASRNTYCGECGDIWLPSVDGDFWPDAPSTLLREGRFANIDTIIGWTEDDMTLYTDPSLADAEATYQTIRVQYPWLSEDNLEKLLALYPVEDFPANIEANRTSESYRAARIWRDILMVCQPMYLAQTLAAAGNKAYLYDWNQTVTGPALASVRGLYGVGVPHTGEFAYTFGNVSVYDVNGYPFDPLPSDFELQHKGARSWSTFANTGNPSLVGRDTFLGWEEAFQGDSEGQPYIWVAGGPNEGLSAVDGPDSIPEIAQQKLRERCAFINSPEMIEELRY